jgi:hypothetical protein
MGKLRLSHAAIVVVLLGIAWAGHDHLTHPDSSFIREECTRVSRFSLDKMVKEIRRYTKDM